MYSASEFLSLSSILSIGLAVSNRAPRRSPCYESCLGLPSGPVLDRLGQGGGFDRLTSRQACPELVEGSAIVRASLRIQRTPRVRRRRGRSCGATSSPPAAGSPPPVSDSGTGLIHPAELAYLGRPIPAAARASALDINPVPPKRYRWRSRASDPWDRPPPMPGCCLFLFARNRADGSPRRSSDSFSSGLQRRPPPGHIHVDVVRPKAGSVQQGARPCPAHDEGMRRTPAGPADSGYPSSWSRCTL
jgi:hypothetical protein